jgi:hypothetical protein
MRQPPPAAAMMLTATIMTGYTRSFKQVMGTSGNGERAATVEQPDRAANESGRTSARTAIGHPKMPRFAPKKVNIRRFSGSDVDDRAAICLQEDKPHVSAVSHPSPVPPPWTPDLW